MCVCVCAERSDAVQFLLSRSVFLETPCQLLRYVTTTSCFEVTAQSAHMHSSFPFFPPFSHLIYSQINFAPFLTLHTLLVYLFDLLIFSANRISTHICLLKFFL